MFMAVLFQLIHSFVECSGTIRSLLPTLIRDFLYDHSDDTMSSCPYPWTSRSLESSLSAQLPATNRLDLLSQTT